MFLSEIRNLRRKSDMKVDKVLRWFWMDIWRILKLCQNLLNVLLIVQEVRINLKWRKSMWFLATKTKRFFQQSRKFPKTWTRNSYEKGFAVTTIFPPCKKNDFYFSDFTKTNVKNNKKIISKERLKCNKKLIQKVIKNIRKKTNKFILKINFLHEFWRFDFCFWWCLRMRKSLLKIEEKHNYVKL